MKKIVLSATLAALLAACSSTPTKPAPAKVDEIKVAPTPAAKTDTPPPPPPQPQAIAPAKPLAEEKVDNGGFPAKGQGGALGERSIYYAFDAFNVSDQYKPIAEAHAGWLAKHRKAHLTLQGNCDERGSREYNLALGQRRGDGVKNLMTLGGASADQIEVVSFGKEKPLAPGHDEESWAKNRRVDLVYQGE